MRLLPCTSFLAAILIASSFAQSFDEPFDDDSSDQGPVACKQSRECGPGMFCDRPGPNREGKCVRRRLLGSPCTNFADEACLEGLHCSYISIVSPVDIPGICVRRGTGVNGICAVKEDCRKGLHCDGYVEGQAAGRCTPPRGLGQRCNKEVPCIDSLFCANGRCAPKRGQYASCRSQDMCQKELYCSKNRCVPKLRVGSACPHGFECAAGLFCSWIKHDNMCMRKGVKNRVGGVCLRNDHCQDTLYCEQPDQDRRGKCAPRRPDGAECLTGQGQCQKGSRCKAPGKKTPRNTPGRCENKDAAARKAMATGALAGLDAALAGAQANRGAPAEFDALPTALAGGQASGGRGRNPGVITPSAQGGAEQDKLSFDPEDAGAPIGQENPGAPQGNPNGSFDQGGPPQAPQMGAGNAPIKPPCKSQRPH